MILYEIVEIKFDISIDSIMLSDVYKKISQTKIQRCYILSTSGIEKGDENNIVEKISKIRKEHGCQIIVNGIFDSLKYYLRLLSNTDDFLNKYTEILQSNHEVKYEHKIAWNTICSTKNL